MPRRAAAERREVRPDAIYHTMCNKQSTDTFWTATFGRINSQQVHT